jgi:hypothetical protein
MTHRERFVRLMSYDGFDRPPRWEYGAWPQTLQRWHLEGLPAHLSWPDHAPQYHIEPRSTVTFRIDMMPPIEEALIEQDERYEVRRRADGRVTRALREGTMDGVRACMDQYIDAPVRDEQDFRVLKRRYDASDPARLPAGWPAGADALADRDVSLSLWGAGAHFGLYMQLRSWMGTERLSYAFFDQPRLVHEMLQFFTDFIVALIEPLVAAAQFDYFAFAEDLAGRSGPLISPAVFATFFEPHYRRIVECCHRAGIHLIYMDSDGDVRPLIPQLMDVGVNWLCPCEAAAGMDPVALRRRFGHDVRVSGGIDKRALAAGPAAIDEELQARLPVLLEDGGYIPYVDHLFSHDIPYAHALYYLDAKARMMDGRHGG